MTTALEYALMAGAAYRATRNPINRLPAPASAGWSEILYRELPDSGFEAVAFQKGDDIVISFSGTDPNNSGLLSLDGQTNGALAAGTWADQLMQAAEYYLQIKAANPGANITLTGHSLGGGLAALIAIFFDVHAQTFDQAPFANSALDWPNGDNATALRTHLASKVNGSNTRLYDDAALTKLTDYLALRAAGQVNGFIPRESNVDTIRVQGEFLDGGFLGNQSFGNTATLLEHGPANWPVTGLTAGPSFDLHSQALLTAFLQSQQSAPNATLGDVTKKLTGLLNLIFEDKLFQFTVAPTNTANENFLERLVRHEAGVPGSFEADAMVTRFTKDLWKLAQDGGLTLTEANVSKTLMAFAMQKYYLESDHTTELFKSETGGISFKRGDVAPTLGETKGYRYFDAYLRQTDTGLSAAEKALIRAELPGLLDWYVQAGAQAMTASAGAQRAFMLGGAGNDALAGGADADLLLGNAGSDALTGGLGNDALMGGADADTYNFSGNFGNDTLIDSDGNGQIVIDSTALTGGKRQSATIWRSDDDKYEFHFAGNVASGERGLLRILRTGVNTEFNSITVRNWRQGELNITLAPDKAALSAPPQPHTSQERTLSAESHGPLVTGEAGVALYNWGADASAWVAEPGFADVTGYSNSEYGASLSKFDNLIASTGAGNDLFVGYTGHDTVDGGGGNDLLIGGPGVNVLKAGAGDDIVAVLGAASFNSPLRTGPQDQWSAPAGAGVLSAGPTRGAYRDSSGMLVFGDGGPLPTATSPFVLEADPYHPDYKSWGNDIDAGEGSDTVFGGLASDSLVLGADDDLAFGFPGNDGVFLDAPVVTVRAVARPVGHTFGHRRGCAESGQTVSKSKRHRPIVEWSSAARKNVDISNGKYKRWRAIGGGNKRVIKLAAVKLKNFSFRNFIAACGFVTALFPATASDLRAGSMCEAAWGDGYISPLPKEQTQQQRALAEKGDAQAQFFMGVATADKAESNQWLQQAIAGGSKGAAAYYAYKRDPRLAAQNDIEKWDRKDPRNPSTCWWPIDGLSEQDQTDLLTPIIAAAEAGEPQPATWLWQMVVGETRYGSTYNRNCKTNHPLLKVSDARKWMEIAGRGGNPWAQEELCSAFSRTVSPQHVRVPDPQWGFTPDPSLAFHWCAIAAQNFCATRSIAAISSLYRRGIGTEKSESIADYWQGRRDQNSGPGRTTRVIRQPILPLR